MTIKYSNYGYVEIYPAESLENVGWYLIAKHGSSFGTIVAQVFRFNELTVMKEISAEGGGSVVIPADDPVFTTPMPNGLSGTIFDYELLWQVVRNGMVVHEWLGEDPGETIIPDSQGGTLANSLSGRGTAKVLEWACALPKDYPGATSSDTRKFSLRPPMALWLLLLQECQAQGYLTWIEVTFSETADSAGQPWLDSLELDITPGENLLELLNRFCELSDLEWVMYPGFLLEVRRTFGTNKEDYVAFYKGAYQLGQSKNRTRRDLANEVIAVAGNGRIASASDSDSIAIWNKRMRIVEIGDAGGVSAAQTAANINLKMLAEESVSKTIEVLPNETTRRIFDDYYVGDYIGIQNSDLSFDSLRVVTATISISDTSEERLELSLMTKWEAREVRLQKLLERMGSGAVSAGTTVIRSSTQAADAALGRSSVGDLVDVDLDLGQSNNRVLTYSEATQKWVPQDISVDTSISDVSITSPNNGDILKYNSSTGLWENTIQSSSTNGVDALDLGSFTDVGMGDEFNEETLNAAWTAVRGSLGIVDLTGAKAASVFDLTSKPGNLLCQGPNTSSGEVIICKDLLMAIGDDVVLAVDLPTVPKSVNNGYHVKLGINDNSTLYSSGTYGYIYVDGSDNDGVQTWNGGSVGIAVGAANFGGRQYLRIRKTDASTYHTFTSTNGRVWIPLGSFTVASATYLWVTAGPSASWTRGTSPDPIACIPWIRHVSGGGIDPWTLAY